MNGNEENRACSSPTRAGRIDREMGHGGTISGRGRGRSHGGRHFYYAMIRAIVRLSPSLIGDRGNDIGVAPVARRAHSSVGPEARESVEQVAQQESARVVRRRSPGRYRSVLIDYHHRWMIRVNRRERSALKNKYVTFHHKAMSSANCSTG